MRHRLSRRIFTAACGLWLALSLSEPAALHVCAMHGSPGAIHDHNAQHSAHGRSDGGHAPAGHGKGSACTCLGGCCAAAAISVPAALPLVADVAVAPLVRVAVPTAIAYRPAAVEYARPPTVGPPQHTA